MKFKTQHVRVMGKHGYILHRDGNTTWRTSMATSGESAPYDVVEHKSVAAAKAILGQLTSAST